MVFLEAWFVFFFFWKLLRNNALAYIYVVLKDITFVLPLVSLSSVDRLPFWYVAILVYVVDVSVVRLLVYYSCHGRDWKRVSRYKRITPNREFAYESTFGMYFSFKTLSFLSYYCYNAVTAAWRFTHPRYPVRGGFAPSMDYFNALVEAATASHLRYGLLLILAASAITIYGVILIAGACNSKYAFVDVLPSVAQMISYGGAISPVLLPVILLTGSLNLAKIVIAQALTTWFFSSRLPVGSLFLIAMLVEANHIPFDLPKTESELGRGYKLIVPWGPLLLFVGEYCSTLLISVLFCALFLGEGAAALPASYVPILKLESGRRPGFLCCHSWHSTNALVTIN